MAESFAALSNSLERATHLIKCLPSASSDNEMMAIYSSLRDAQQNIHSFLQQQPLLLSGDQNGVVDCLTVDDNNNNNNNTAASDEMQEDQPMPGMDDDEMEKLQESIQGCALQNKRRKRSHSPPSIHSSYGQPVDLHYLRRQGPQVPVFKSQDRQHKFDLIFQFHG